MKRIAVYSDYLALQCGLMGYTIDTINGRHDFSCLPSLHLWGGYAVFSFVMQFVAIEECKQIYGRNGNMWFRTGYSCCCRSAVNGFVMRFVAFGECMQ